ncbi:MAG: diadenylate cyclase CdaA [Solobacterium sp.]|nr:diadenylate cyclase CdaA [Solobacterium sp.]
MFLDIFIMWMVLYNTIRLVQSNSKTVQIFKGVLLILIIDSFATLLGLKTVSYVTNIFINWGFLAIIIIFQPEIRSVLERLGKTNVFTRITTLTGNEKENLVDQIVTATMLLSNDQTGALISIEQSHTLEDFIATGTKLNSDVTAELLTSIFVTSTPLHDGAVIIRGDKIACASAYFPPTNLELPSRYGARHRAAIGISEITDAVTIVVSEETGAISITEGGTITTVNRKQLRDYLLRVICGEETEVTPTSRPKLNNEAARDVIIEDTETKKTDEQVKGGLTGTISKLAIKRQEAKREKIPVEAVVNGEKDKVTPAKEDANPDAGIKRIEEGAHDIKLPRKKERPVPSYPEHSASHRFEENKRAEMEAQKELVRAKEAEMAEIQRAREEAAKDALRKEAEDRVRRADELRMRELQQREAQQREAQQQEAQQRAAAETANGNRRMTAEEVQAQREAARRQLSGKPEQPLNPNGVIMDDKSRQFDTTKLDLSKIMGMNDELTKTFQMLDSLEDGDKSSKKKGGNR